MSALLEGLKIDGTLIIAQMVIFLFTLGILTFFVYKPVFKILNTRRERIETSLQKADEIDQQMEDIKTYHQEQLIKARDEAQEIITEARRTADEETEAKLVKTQKEVSLLFDKAKKEISAEKEEMMKNIEKQTAKMLIPAVEKILQETVDEETRRKIHAQSVKKVAQLYN